MAKKKTKQSAPRLIEIARHITGPPRRSPGQRLVLTLKQIKAQGLKDGDYKIVEE